MRQTSTTLALFALIIGLFLTVTASASQTNIVGPAGSGQFGTSVTVLPNGNIVVTDPFYDLSGPTVADVGAVHLYSGATLALISTLTGSKANDQVGNAGFPFLTEYAGVTVLTNGNYVVRSPNWDNPSPLIADVGAVTWCSATVGCSGVVSAANSLIGGRAFDQVGSNDSLGKGVTALTNGNYVFISPYWDNPSSLIVDVGAVTWGNGTTGTSGLVTAANSLIGGTAFDIVGGFGVTALTNGNYVVSSAYWDNPSSLIVDVGAATWGNGTTGTSGIVTAANSLIGGRVDDNVGFIKALTNGNYVVLSGNWDNPSPLRLNVGAVTWGNGASGTSGLVTAANSLIGGRADDGVGEVTALTNGNYVVSTYSWDNPSPLRADVGAVTWGNGTTGTSGVVTAANSLIGSTGGDSVGRVTALTNGNYVVSSLGWDNPSPLIVDVGAVTWGNGTTGTSGLVTVSNSLIGGRADDAVGRVTALTNGNYVVSTYRWSNPSPFKSVVGAVTWGNGTTGISGLVTSANSLIGGTAFDGIGFNGVTALTNGNYVVASEYWNNPSPFKSGVGAVTWSNGTTGSIGVVTAANSLIGGTTNDRVGSSNGSTANGVTALTNGNYVVSSLSWNNPSPLIASVGAVTWGNGTTGSGGVVTAANSLIGGTANDQVGSINIGDGGVTALTNGNYVVRSPLWDNPSVVVDATAVTFGNGANGTNGLVTSTNSVVGTVTNGTNIFSYDATRNRLFVGRKLSNIVSVMFFNTTAIVDGNSNNPATWDNGLPNALVNGIIPNGRTVTLDSILNAGQIAVECGGTLTGGSATAYVNGSIRKEYCAAVNETFIFPLGDADDYSPMQTANVNGTGRLTVSVSDALLPDLLSAHSASRFWTLSGTGITTDLSFTYTDGDVSGTETAYNVYRRFSTTTTQATPATVNAATNTATVTGVSSFSDWGVGNLFAPLAANVSVAGRVTAANGNGIRNVVVSLTDSNGNTRTARTGAFGYYNFDDVEAGETYTVNVAAKRFTFANPTQVITVKDSIADVDFTAE